jgi:hypothetical protein
MRCIAGIALLLAVGACATPVRMYTSAELGRAGATCGLALGELAQEEEEPRLLFMIVPNPAAAQQECVRRWSRRRSLNLVILEGLERIPDAPTE